MTTLGWNDPDQSETNLKVAQHLLFQISLSGNPTNSLPFLSYLPAWVSPWKKAEKKRRDDQNAWWLYQLTAVKRRMQHGSERSCWAQQYLETASESRLSSDVEASRCIGFLVLAGVLTASSPLQFFQMAMVHHPEWLLACQQEIDIACEGRMPTLADSPNLPTLRACIKETMRWRPSIPIGVPHVVAADDEHLGYRISKGTTVLAMEW